MYVENLIWVMQEPNNTIRCDEYQYIRKSKKSLLIFKHTNPETAKIELRHQRSADVVFDFVKNDKGESIFRSDVMYNVVDEVYLRK